LDDEVAIQFWKSSGSGPESMNFEGIFTVVG